MTTISLSAGVRSNLLSLQGTANLLAKTQNRLATGLKVNNPLDDAAAFFTAQGLNSRANDLSSIMQGMQNGLKTIDAASKGLSAITKTMENMIGQVRQALQDPGNATVRQNVGIVTNGNFAGNSIVIGEGDDATAVSITLDLTEFGEDSPAQLAQRAANYINETAKLSSNGVTAEVDNEDLIIINNSGRQITLIYEVTLEATNPLFNGQTLITAIDQTNMSDARRSLMNSYNDLRAELNAIARDSGYNGNNLLMGDMLNVVFNELSGADRTRFSVSAKQSNGSAFGHITAESLNGVAGTANIFGSNYELENLLESLQNGVGELRSLSSQLGTAQTIVENRRNFTNELINTLRAGADGMILADMNEEAANSLALQTKQQIGQSALSLAIRSDQSILALIRTASKIGLGPLSTTL